MTVRPHVEVVQPPNTNLVRIYPFQQLQDLFRGHGSDFMKYSRAVAWYKRQTQPINVIDSPSQAHPSAPLSPSASSSASASSASSPQRRLQMPCYLPIMLVDQLYPRIHPSPHVQLISTIFVPPYHLGIRSPHHGSLVAASRPTKCIPLVEANALAELDVLNMRLASRPPSKNPSAPALQALGILSPDHDQ